MRLIKSTHLEKHQLTYFTHMRHALAVSRQLAAGAATAAIHAFAPDAYTRRTSEIVRRVHEQLHGSAT
jgi:hypothetical protein